MELSGTMSQVLAQIKNTAPIKDTKASYLASLVKLQDASDTVAGQILSDTAEISKSAMNKYLSEIK